MADTPLTFPAIRAMHDDVLNLLIDRHCTTHQWTRVSVPSTGASMWELRDDKGAGRLWSSVPHLHYAASWDRTMALRHTHGQYIDLVWWGTIQRVRSLYGDMPFIDCTTEEEVRRAICQLVLWQTLARQAWDAEEAAAQERAAAEENRLSNGEAPHADV